MALEAAIYPQEPFSYSGSKDLYSLLVGGSWGNGFCPEREDEQAGSYDFLENQTESSLFSSDWNCSPPPSSIMVPHFDEPAVHFSDPSPVPIATNGPILGETTQFDASNEVPIRPRRRRSRSRKNKEEIENQRMTHITVERNRRKQMNEYLSVLRSLMPDSYVQRGDQASIIGGAINFVKELEQQIQYLSAHTDTTKLGNSEGGGGPSVPFSDFFTFPQYTTTSSTVYENSMGMADHESVGENQSSIADIEVNIVESHANIKIRSPKRPKQLLKMVAGLHTLRLTVLHLNLTSFHHFVLYSFSVKVEDDCKLNSVDEIATALYQLLSRIQEETMLN